MLSAFGEFGDLRDGADNLLTDFGRLPRASDQAEWKLTVDAQAELVGSRSAAIACFAETPPWKSGNHRADRTRRPLAGGRFHAEA